MLCLNVSAEDSHTQLLALRLIWCLFQWLKENMQERLKAVVEGCVFDITGSKMRYTAAHSAGSAMS